MTSIRTPNFSVFHDRSAVYTARSAEVSKTILLIAGGLSPFGEQFVGQRPAGFNMLANKPLRSGRAASRTG